MLLVSMIGGAGTVYGPLIGAVLLAVLSELTRSMFSFQGLSLVLYAQRSWPFDVGVIFQRRRRLMLKVKGLSKIFGGLRAVDNASLEVGQGQIVALIGPNGAGKTTLFASIAGFHKIDEGQVAFLGQSIVGLQVHEIARLGMVRTFQITQPFAKLTVLENIAVGAFQQFRSKNEAHAHARLIAEKVGMSGMLDQP
eukprot:gene5474-7246_t